MSKRIEELEYSLKFWRDEAIKMTHRAAEYAAKLEVYEHINNKLRDRRTSDTDEVFMFKGVYYRPYNFQLNHRPGKDDILYIKFVKT